MSDVSSSLSRLQIDLSLLDVSADVANDDTKASRLVQLVEDHLSCRNATTSAENFLLGVTSTQEEVKSIQHQVLRFLQPKDKYAAWASLLLKSRAFHLVFNTEQTETNHKKELERRGVVCLPRTAYKKPYIPASRKEGATPITFEEQDLWPVSISHQHPFVGIVQFSKPVNRQRESPLLLGLDIVVFEAYNPRLYSNTEEFLEVFRDYFTPREWGIIQSQPESFRLEEFYMRWSMKEAYTKALGVGMGLDFSALDLVLDMDRETENPCLLTSCQGHTILYHSAKVNYLKDDKLSGKDWTFNFHLLEGADAKGSACVCAGPIRGEGRNLFAKPDLVINWNTIQDLMQYHQI